MPERNIDVSRRRNPLVAEMLRRIHLVEAWGRGMPLILENAPDVKFSELAGLFIASFSRSMAQEAAQETPKNTEERQRTPRNAKEVLLQLLRQQPESSVRALAETSGMSEASVRHHLRRLQAANRLRHVGPTKGGHWEVID